MKKVQYAAITICGILLISCCGFFAYQSWNLGRRYQTLETEASALRDDNSKLQKDKSKLDTELTDSTAQLEEKERYVAGQKEYISELSGQIESLTEGGDDESDSQTANGNSRTDNDADDTADSENSTNMSSGSDAYPNLYAEGCSPEDSKKVVYLTFDDGPSNLTPKVLDLLDRYHAKATFFVVCNNNEEYAEYLSEIVERGHTLALHSYSHNYDEIYASKDAFLRDYEKVYDWVVKNTGYTPSLFRFPGGSNNGSSYVVNGIIDEMEERGFQYFDWNVSSGDGSELTTTENIIDNICSNVGVPEFPIVLMHDGRGKNATLAALPTVLEYLSDNGYEFRSLDKTVEAVHYR
jgi:peptidoglycan/xylan/chitin deacetylase (PgdA/CDA1 family)